MEHAFNCTCSERCKRWKVPESDFKGHIAHDGYGGQEEYDP
jgi:hypothetical protein